MAQIDSSSTPFDGPADVWPFIDANDADLSRSTKETIEYILAIANDDTLVIPADTPYDNNAPSASLSRDSQFSTMLISPKPTNNVALLLTELQTSVPHTDATQQLIDEAVIAPIAGPDETAIALPSRAFSICDNRVTFAPLSSGMELLGPEALAVEERLQPRSKMSNRRYLRNSLPTKLRPFKRRNQPVTEGNNKTGRKGMLRCIPCRITHTKV